MRTIRTALLILVLMTIGCDRVTKHLATTRLAGKPRQSYIADTLQLEYSENTGAFLSFGAALPTRIRAALFTWGVGFTLTLLALVALKRWVGFRLVGAALMWAGGTSNLVDRVAHGSVVDFVSIGVGSLRTGIFNIADLAIVLGFAFVVMGFRQARQ